MKDNLFTETSELLKDRGVLMTAQEVEDFCLGGESLDDVYALDLVSQIMEYVGE